MRGRLSRRGIRSCTLIARKSTLLLLREALYGTTRFDDFVRRTGMAESVTASQLRALTAEGLLVTRAYREPGQRRRSEYVLTDAGRDLIPVLLALAAWGDRHLPREHGLHLTHAACGADIETGIRCAAGHAVAEDEIVVGLERRS